MNNPTFDPETYYHKTDHNDEDGYASQKDYEESELRIEPESEGNYGQQDN